MHNYFSHRRILGGARRGNASPKMTTVVVFGKLLMKFLAAFKAKYLNV